MPTIAILKSANELGLTISTDLSLPHRFNGKDTCVICYDVHTHPVICSCKHIFCMDCISNWVTIKSTCPLCRRILIPRDILVCYETLLHNTQ